MRSLDDDGSRRLEGKELQGIEIWRDANRDGVSDAGESQSLAAWRITSLSCDFSTMVDGENAIAYSPAGAIFGDGSTRPTYDALLTRR